MWLPTVWYGVICCVAAETEFALPGQSLCPTTIFSSSHPANTYPSCLLSSMWIDLLRNDTFRSVTRSSLTDSSNLNKLWSTKCLKMIKWQQFHTELLHFVYFRAFYQHTFSLFSYCLFYLLFYQFYTHSVSFSANLYFKICHLVTFAVVKYIPDLHWNILYLFLYLFCTFFFRIFVKMNVKI